MRKLVLIAAVSATTLVLAPAGAAASSCPKGEFRTTAGCKTLAKAGRGVEDLVRQFMVANDLKAVLLRIDVGDRTMLTITPGKSMAGVPANARMRFRIGAIAIPYLIDLLLQLQDREKLSLDDPLAKYLPQYPNADRVTLRNLANSISGYPDWSQGNPAFIDAFLNDVFYQWRMEELLNIAFSQPLICDPGACFYYAHTNFALLARVVHEVTGQPVARLIRDRILDPLGLRQTRISGLPGIPKPVLHAYSAARGPYEDSTYWSPTRGISKSLLMTSTIGDVIKTAKAVGTGALVSRAGARQRVAPTTVGLSPSMTPSFYFGLGIEVANSWRVQNPAFNGHNSIMAYLPSRRISFALSVTNGPSGARSPDADVIHERLFEQISAYLAPNSPADFPG